MNWNELLERANEIHDEIESNLHDEGKTDHIDELILTLIDKENTMLRNVFIRYFKTAIDITLHYAEHGDHDKSQYANYENVLKKLRIEFKLWDSTQIPIELLSAEELAKLKQES